MPSALLDRRLLFVTGKGGVGKTTIAAALGQLAAVAGPAHAAVRGRRQGQPGRRVRDRADRSSSQREVAPGLWAMSMDTEASLQGVPRASSSSCRCSPASGPLARTFDFVANAAPGVKEILVVGKLVLRGAGAPLRPRRGRRAGVGPHRRPAGGARRPSATSCRWAWSATRPSGCSTSSATRPGPAWSIVSTPEEMPVNETLELAEPPAGRDRRSTWPPVVVNRVLPELFSPRRGGGVPGPAASRTRRRRWPRPRAARRAGARRRRAGGASCAGPGPSTWASCGPACRPGVDLLYVPELFQRTHGVRATRQIAEALGAELGY